MRVVKYPNEYKTWINKNIRRFNFELEFNGKKFTTKELSSIKITSTLLPSDTFTIGSSVAETLEFELFLDSDTSINKALPVKPYLSLYTEVMINNVLTPVWQKVCLGVYYINSDGIIKNGLKSLKIKASSMMNNTNYCGRTYVAAENFNGDITVIVNDICSKLGVSLKGTLPSITISKRDNINGMTYREVLNYIATLYGGYVKFNNEGNIEFFKMKDSGYIYDTSNYSEIAQTSGETLTIKKFLCALTEDSSLSSGQGSIAETVELINPDMIQSLLDGIKNEYLNYSYSPMKIKVLTGNPILEAGDRIKVIDQKGKTCEVPLQNVTYNLSGSGLTMEIESKYKINSIAKGTSIRKAVSQLNQEIIKTNIIVAEEIEATNGKFENIKTDIADINIAIIDKADIKELNAIKGTINVLDSDLANIKTLVNANLSSENIQAGGITSDRLTIADGFINNAMIANLDVSKINAGDISTNKFRIVSDSGKMLIADNTIQIRDNNRARVQIGKDASNDYSMYVWDNTGKLMFDATGLKADGIKDNIIRDDMISDNANIDGSKININSLVTEINKDTNTNVIKSSKIKLDTVGQTLDVAFDKLKTQADANANLTESTSTTINVMQGQISTAINNTQIVKDGKTTLLKDDYNKTVAKVDSINSTLGSHTTKIDQLTGNITNVDTKVNNIKRDLEGTISTISSHSASIDNLNSTVSTQSSSISQLKDKIALKVEQTDINNAITSVENKVASTNSKVASLETNLSSITSRVSATESNIKTTNDDISSLQTRMNTAEQKITDSAIINTVQSTINNAKNEAINSANSSTDNKLNNYATKSSMELTANQLRLDFSSSGGMNLVKDGQFKAWDWNNGKWWWFDSNVRIYERNVVNGTGVGFYSEDSSRARLYSNYMNLKPNTTYTVVMDLAKEGNVYYDNVSVEFKNSNGDILYTHNCSTNGSTFTTPYNTSGGYLIITHGGRSNSNGGFVLWVNNVAIYEGTTALPYSPHPDEVYEGNTVIDAQGIKIYNGALTVLNKNRDVMLQADNDGNLTFKGRLQPNDYQLKLFGNDCRIDGSANAIRMQLTPQIYCGMDSEGGFRIFNQHSNWGSRYISALMTYEGHASIYNDRTRIKLLGAQNDRPVVQSRNSGDNAYGDFHGADFLNRSTIKDKTNVQDTQELDCTKIILENDIFKYNLKSDVQYILEKFGLDEEYDLSDIEGCSADERVGFILEELTEEAKEILSPGDMESISIYSMCSILWKAFQEQQKRIETLESLLKK